MLSREMVISQLENTASILIDADKTPSNGKKTRGVPRKISFNKPRLAEVTGLEDKEIKALLDEIENDGIYVGRNASNHLDIDIDCAHAFLDKAKILSIEQMRNSGEHGTYYVPVCIVNISKGGVGKTTTAIELATVAALDLSLRQRVLLIDNDPQGSISNLLSPMDLNSTFESFSWLIEEGCSMRSEERRSAENQERFRSEVKKMMLNTHLENLFVLPASFENAKLDTAIAQCLAKFGIDDAMSVIDDVIIQPIKADIDLIVIDTAPASNLTTVATYYASNNVFFVTTGREQDMRSYTKHQLYLADAIKRIFPSDFQGFNSMGTIITRHLTGKTELARSIQHNAAKIKMASSTLGLIHESKKYEEAASKKLPLMLVDSNNDKPYRTAVSEINSLYIEFNARLGNRFEG